MSKLWTTPVKVQYKVNFYSGGDTTRDAFSKHIQELDRIYGLLNALDSAKVSASDISGLSSTVGSITSQISSLNTALTNHINSSNPHPNYHPSWNDLTNKPKLSDLSGNLDADRINGLDSKIASQIPAPSGDGITSQSMNGNGYAKFKNGLILQWGKTTLNRSGWTEDPHAVSFPIAFTNSCFSVAVSTEAEIPDSDSGAVDCMCQVKDITSTGFKYMVQRFHTSETNNWTKLHCNYIAIGK